MYHLSNIFTTMQNPVLKRIESETFHLIKNKNHELSDRCTRGLAIKYGINEINVLKAADPFHPETNPTGHIDLSSADNFLNLEIIQDRFNAINWTMFDATELVYYTTPGGTLETRQVFANLMNKISVPGLKYPVNPNHLLVVSGTTMICDLLGQVLFDEGDVMMTHSPYYHRFPNDFSDRGLIEIVETSIFSGLGTSVELSVEKFENLYQKETSKGKRVRAILLVNPRNPDGGYFTLKELKPVVDWAVKKRGLYVILDEIYDLAVYDPRENEPYESGIKLFDQDPGLNKNKLIWMSGLSKNFSLPGLRTAVMYTVNQKIYSATKRFLMYQGPNSTTEFLTRQLLANTEWLEKIFLPNSHQLLRTARDLVIDFFKNLKQRTGKEIQWIHPRAGFFIYVDFHEFMDSQTFEGEEHLQRKFFNKKILFVRGNSLKMEYPGWFRIVFTSYSLEVLVEGLRRIEAALLA